MAILDWIHIFYIELLDKFKIGVKVKIKYTMKCNLRCTYCSVTLPCGDRAEFEELTNAEWLQRIDSFPMKIRKIIIVGGEPFFRKGIIELVEELTKRRILVKILTNLTYKRIMELPRTPYLKLIATYHTTCNLDHFKAQYAQIRKKYRILVYELIGTEKLIPDSKPLTLYEDVSSRYYRRDFVIAPNGEYVMSLINLYRMTGKHKKYTEEFNEIKNDLL